MCIDRTYTISWAVIFFEKNQNFTKYYFWLLIWIYIFDISLHIRVLKIVLAQWIINNIHKHNRLHVIVEIFQLSDMILRFDTNKYLFHFINLYWVNLDVILYITLKLIYFYSLTLLRILLYNHMFNDMTYSICKWNYSLYVVNDDTWYTYLYSIDKYVSSYRYKKAK